MPSPQKTTHNEALFSYFRGETKQDDLTVSSWAKLGYCSAAPGVTQLMISKCTRVGMRLVEGNYMHMLSACSWQLSTWWGPPARRCLVPAAAKMRSWTLQHVLRTSTTCKHILSQVINVFNLGAGAAAYKWLSQPAAFRSGASKLQGSIPLCLASWHITASAAVQLN